MKMPSRGRGTLQGRAAVVAATLLVLVEVTRADSRRSG
jgi:hypothetical protein